MVPAGNSPRERKRCVALFASLELDRTLFEKKLGKNPRVEWYQRVILREKESGVSRSSLRLSLIGRFLKKAWDFFVEFSMWKERLADNWISHRKQFHAAIEKEKGIIFPHQEQCCR